MKTKHTAGPWNVDGIFICDDEGDRIVAEMPKMYDENDYANARLIAAAPDLLQACQAADWNSLDSRTRFRVKNAIRKALGEEK